MPFPVQAYVALVDSSGNAIGTMSPTVPPGGRIAASTATPVPTAAVTAATSVFYTPYVSNYIPIWNGSVWVPTVFTELANVLANSSVGNAGPAAGAAAKNYDLFVWNSSGTLYLTRGGAWNSDTARSATTENDLQRVQGVLCNLNAITNGPAAGYGVYVGTIRTDASGATVTFDPGGAAAGGTQGWCGFWNMYNQVGFGFSVSDTTATWPYTSSTVRSANNSATYRVSFVRGLNQGNVVASYVTRLTSAAVAGSSFTVGIGLDVTNAHSTTVGTVSPAAAAAIFMTPAAFYNALPGLGFHFLSALEQGDNVNAYTLAGTSATLNALKVSLWA